ncbi:MAG: Threonine dehydratase, catabolic [Parcubacteria bacterium 34_609]|nr:MAG: Threonine dehydratase, catabolic [Parcubacteria bacterium 34_609]
MDNKIIAADIFEARKRISSLIYKTPLRKSIALSKRVGAHAYYKLEFLQETGSFKIRGAANFLVHLDHSQLSKGVVAYSTGNHGKATAYMATLIGSKAKICLSQNVPAHKQEEIKKVGGEVIVVGKSQDEAEIRALELKDREGLSVVPPFDHPYIIMGQGTIGLEILEDLPNVDTVIVPVSGGGLISGIATVIKINKSNCRIIGVSMNRGAAMFESVQQGKPVQVEEVETLADSLQGGILLDNQYTFDIVRKYVDDIILVTEEEIALALTYVFLQDHYILEGAAAVGIAALLAGKVRDLGKNVVIVLTGNNVDNNQLLSVIKNNKDKIIN